MTFAQFKAGVLLLFAAGVGHLVATAGPDSWTVPESTAALKSPFASDPAAAVSKGKELYRDRCNDCHGTKGKGNGSAAADLSRKPTDLTAPAAAEQTDGSIFWKITEGRRPMPGFRGKLSEEERWQLVAYLRTLHRKDSKPTKPKPKPKP